MITDGMSKPDAKYPDVKVGSEIGMSFELDPVELSPYGSAHKLSGVIPFILPLGEYIQPTLLENKERFEIFLREKSAEYADLFPNELDGTILDKVSDYLIFAASAYTDQDITQTNMESYVAATIVPFAIDDILDNLSETKRIKQKSASKFIRFFLELLTGKYALPEDVPNTIEALAPIKYFLWKMVNLSQKCISGFTARNKEFIYEVKNSLWAHLLMGVQSGYSAHAREVFGALNNGTMMAIEYIALHKNIQLTEDVRRDILFQQLKIATGMASHGINDVFGIVRDIEKDQVKDSNILTNVLLNEVPLQTAFENELLAVADFIQDIKSLAKLLRENYSNEESVSKYIRCIEESIDGSLYYYSKATRYGNINAKVVGIPMVAE